MLQGASNFESFIHVQCYSHLNCCILCKLLIPKIMAVYLRSPMFHLQLWERRAKCISLEKLDIIIGVLFEVFWDLTAVT